MNNEGFRITDSSGFHITFPNGYTVSVQFGPGNYCSNQHMRIRQDEAKAGEDGCPNAETAFWHGQGELIVEGDDYDSVQGYQTVDQVMQRLIRVYNLPKREV